MKLYTQLITPIPINGGLNITFPPEMSFTTSTTGINCTMNIPNGASVKCTQASEPNKIMATFLTAIPSGSFEIQINKAVKNPTSTTPTSSFQFVTFSSAGPQLDQLSVGISLVATVGSFVNTNLRSDDDTVGVTTNLAIKLTASHRIPSNGQIKMTFPKWNPESATDQLEYLQGAISCSSLNTAFLQTNLQCSFSNSILTITNLASKDIPGGQEISFKISGFRNPLSTALVSGFQFQTQDNLGGNIDITTGVGATLKVNTPSTISTTSFTVDPSTSKDIAGYVGESNIMQLSFSSPVPLNQGCKIIVTFPSQFNLDSLQIVTISGLLGVQRTINVAKQNNYQFSFSSCSSYTQNQLQGIIKLDSLTLPGISKTSERVTIEIRDRNDNQIAVTSQGPNFTPIPGTGLQIALVANPDTILSSSELTITVTSKRTIGLVGQFVLQFPDRYVLSSGVCSSFTALTTAYVNSAAQCSFSGNTLTLTNFISRTVEKSQNIVLQFKVGRVTLPPFLADRSFLGWIKQQDNTDKIFYNVELFNGVITHKMSYGSITAQVTPFTLTAYENTNYTFTITPEHRLEVGGIIEIFYPRNISIPDPSFSQSQCRGFSGFLTTPTCVIDATQRKITINNGFRIPYNLPASTIPSYSFNMPGFLNPLTLDTTDSFKMYTKTSDQKLMDQLEADLTIKMNRVPFIRNVLLTPGILVNSAITNYTFLITPTVPLNNSYSVLLSFPSEITLPRDANSLRCTSDDTGLISSVSCSLFSSSTLSITTGVKATLTLRAGVTGINPLQTFRITVNGIKNPLSTKQTTSFDVILTDTQVSPLSSLNKVSNPVTIMTNTPSTLKSANFSANTTGAGQIASYTIKIMPENKISAGGGIIIIYPSQIGTLQGISITGQVSGSSIRDNVKPTTETSSRRIMFSNLFATDYLPDQFGLQITISGFVNPLYNTEKTNSFIVRTMNQEGTGQFFIDQVTDGLILNAPCDYPCSTCPADKPSVCLSCYQTSELNKLQGQTCVSVCSTGKFYNQTNFSCDNCSPTCLACQDRADKCTQCGVGDLLYLYKTTCLNDCPDGWVEDSTKNLCNKCVNNCKTCEFTETTCTSCYTDQLYKYFYQKNCFQTCPKDISVPVANFQCADCDPMCKTCSIKTTNCTSCLSHMRYDSVKGTCTSVCQEGFQIYDSKAGVCEYCDDNCNTCAGNITTCTSCKNNLVLTTDNNCKNKCTMDNQIPISNICKTCELPCVQCKGTLNTCTKCQDNYLLHNRTCVQYCPEKYRAENISAPGFRQCIYEGLICPAGFHVNDAGDGCIPNEFECPTGYIINQEKTACVPAPGSIVPFPFLFLSACLGILVLGSHIKDKFFTKVYTCLIALLGMSEILIYGIMVCYAGANENWAAFIFSGGAFCMQITANIIFYLIYRKEIVNDQIFAKWCRMYPKTSRYISLLAVFINFKCIKLLYSGFYGLESCLAQFQDPIKNFFRPMRMITYFSFVFVYVPIIIADVIIFIQVEWGYQLLILAVESFLLAILITVLTLIEFRNPEKLLMSGDEQYIRIKPRNFDGGPNVMGAMVDVDESTLIRSRVIDDDYEIQLRKRALIQILEQVGKNFFEGKDKGVHLGQDLDKCMSKFDEEKIKLRRAFSLEQIKEEDESWIASDLGDNKMTESDDEGGYISQEEVPEHLKKRRHSFPLSPKSRKEVPDPNFKQQIKEIQQANLDFMQQDNVYADCKVQDKSKDERRKKTVSRRTQTYLRELLMMDGDAWQDSDMEVILDDDAEIDKNLAKDLIEGVLDVLSDNDSQSTGLKKKKPKKKKGKKNAVPEFELVDIMGEFEIDDLGNFIILRGERGELLDKKERRVNRRGYLIDRFGNVINKETQIIFKAIELDSDDEIPAPFGFEKRKKNLLSIGEEPELFKVKETEKQVPDDEDLIDKELKAMRKSGKRKKRQLEDGKIVEEVGDEGEESSVDSLMAESPAKYNGGAGANASNSNLASASGAGADENALINKLTQMKVPKKKAPVDPSQSKSTVGQQKPPQSLPHVKRILSPKSKAAGSKTQTAHGVSTLSELPPGVLPAAARPKSVYGPPKRIKREDTKELFPSLAIESIEQRKLFKIAESIGGMANQIAHDNLSRLNLSDASINQGRIVSQIDQEQLEKLKQEHYKDLINESQMSIQNQHHHQQYLASNINRAQHHQSDQRLPPRANKSLEKIYGNLNDVVRYEEKIIESKMKGMRDLSPTESQVTLKKQIGRRQDRSEGRRMNGLEAIYLQKFDPKQPKVMNKGSSKAKFRTTLQQFVDDPELLIDDGIDHQRQNEMSNMVAEKLDRLQRQYVTSHQSNRLSSLPITSMGFTSVPNGGTLTVQNQGQAIMRQTGGSMSGLTLNNELSQLDPVMKGNWMGRTNDRNTSFE